jgi:hypothetical protein
MTTQEDELLRLLEVKDHPVVYDGFEPSGRMHIAQGVLRALNVNKLTKVTVEDAGHASRHACCNFAKRSVVCALMRIVLIVGALA